MISIYDNFLRLPEHMRASALRSGFGTWRPSKGDIGLSEYQGMNFWGDHVQGIRALWAVLGPVFPAAMFFRVTNPLTDRGIIHSDRANARFTALVYLTENPPAGHGTGFYRHRGLGITEMPSLETMLADRETYGPLYEQMLGAREEDWEQTAFVEGKWNRCVVFEASQFHCRLPKLGFGKGDEGSRMVWACHFDKV